MNVKFRDSFSRDIKALDRKIKLKIEAAINEIEKAENVAQLQNIKKMKGNQAACRIRVGDYRVGIFINGNVIEFTRCLHRKEIYRYFP